ncbi:DNA primase [Pasteurellaceae bacterium USgator11]|nr:DNA primase [Pasteurellaceae bacterium USgator41]TNG96454.1 DNA primase [Pasteurellaceae bacterium UScroc12]TNH00464.1 DNA primase [Pasteurellaceae bacterium UScroc31]TNH01705.1 DNA primase [Pasteurellaceae bacterium USgator11]
MRTVEAVKGKWALVFKALGLPPITGGKHYKGECPLCKKKDHFRIDDKDGGGTWICSCGSGDGWKLIQSVKGWDFKTAAAEVDRIIGNTYDNREPKAKPQASDADRLRLTVGEKFKTLPPVVRNTGAEAYFNNRGITELPIKSVRYAEAESTPIGTFECLFSIATDEAGNPCYLHRTFLSEGRKAAIDRPKRMNSLQNESYLIGAQSVAIRMFPTSDVLGIAEGIETALSCKQIYRCNTWSTLNAGFMRKFKAPRGVKHLYVFADSDKNGTGLASAFECANKNILANNDVEKVTVRWCEKGDFNDLLQDGQSVYEWSLSR